MNSSRIGAALRWLSTARRNARLMPTNQSTQVAHAAGSGSRVCSTMARATVRKMSARSAKWWYSDGAATFSSRASRGRLNASRPSRSMIRSDASTTAS